MLHRASNANLHCLPACTVILPAEPALERSSWDRIPTSRPETFPIQLQLCSLLLISISTNQSEHFHSDQSKQCFLVDSNCEVWNPICMRADQRGTRGRDFSLYMSAPGRLGECTFPFHKRKHLPGQTCDTKAEGNHLSRHQMSRPDRLKQSRVNQDRTQ